LFSRAEGEVLSTNRITEVLAEHSEAAGIRRIHNYAIRHTFASHAVMRGIPIRQVQEWLGHGSIVVTIDPSSRGGL
jgi:site-specific recombinase XerD